MMRAFPNFSSSLFFLLIFLAQFESLLSVKVLGKEISFADMGLIFMGALLLTEALDKVSIFLASILVIGLSASYLASPSSALTPVLMIPLRFLVAAQSLKIFYRLCSWKMKNLLLSISCILQTLLILCFTGLVFQDPEMEILNKNQAGGYLIILVLLVMNVWRPTISTSHIIFFGLFLISILLKSRQIILGTTCAYFFFCLGTFSLRGLFYISSKKVLVFFAAALIVPISFWLISPDSDWEERRYQSILKLEPMTGSDVKRLNNAQSALAVAQTDPILGRGLGSFRAESELHLVAHSTLIAAFYENGIVGVFIYFCMIALILRAPYCLSLHKGSFEGLILVGSLLIIPVIQSLFIDMFGKLILPIAFAMALLVVSEMRMQSRRLIKSPTGSRGVPRL